jgi:hypothetical protein
VSERAKEQILACWHVLRATLCVRASVHTGQLAREPRCKGSCTCMLARVRAYRVLFDAYVYHEIEPVGIRRPLDTTCILERLAATGVWYPQFLDLRQKFLLNDALE